MLLMAMALQDPLRSNPTIGATQAYRLVGYAARRDSAA
jgi:hypothetical protein